MQSLSDEMQFSPTIMYNMYLWVATNLSNYYSPATIKKGLVKNENK
jgi:hypothetical protein